MTTDITPAAPDLTGLYSAIDSAQSVIAFSSRDWSRTADDAWLYGILCGWNGEPDEPGDSNTMDELAARFGWSADDVERLKTLHASVAGLTINAVGDELGLRAEVERLREELNDERGSIKALAATRRITAEANTYLRAQILVALGERDDGRTPLSDQLARLCTEADRLRGEVERLSDALTHAENEVEALRP